MERKEAELDQLRVGTIRGTAESQRNRTVSPLHMPRNGLSTSLKPEIFQRPVDESKSYEVRSCSSGKQRRSRLPSKFTDKDNIQKLPFLAEERLVNSGKPRSPSPPVRRSFSTDRGALTKSRIKSETIDSLPITKLQFPPRVSVNKYSSAENNTRGYLGSQEQTKPDNIADAFYSFQRANSKKFQQEHEEDEQFKQALNVRHGGIRKGKPESKAKAKHQIPTKIQKSDANSDLDTRGKIEEARKSDFSELENELGPIGSPVLNTLRVKRLPRNSSRNSQNVEPREIVETVEILLAGRNENKLSSGVIRSKESSNTSMPQFRRSRSSPRGKFLILP